MHIFFTVKNTMLMFLMVYRLYVLGDKKRKEGKEGKPANKDEYVNLDEDTASVSAK